MTYRLTRRGRAVRDLLAYALVGAALALAMIIAWELGR